LKRSKVYRGGYQPVGKKSLHLDCRYSLSQTSRNLFNLKPGKCYFLKIANRNGFLWFGDRKCHHTKREKLVLVWMKIKSLFLQFVAKKIASSLLRKLEENFRNVS
jgi:hypothetical protein